MGLSWAWEPVATLSTIPGGRRNDAGCPSRASRVNVDGWIATARGISLPASYPSKDDLGEAHEQGVPLRLFTHGRVGDVSALGSRNRRRPRFAGSLWLLKTPHGADRTPEGFLGGQNENFEGVRSRSTPKPRISVHGSQGEPAALASWDLMLGHVIFDLRKGRRKGT